ncbi:F-box/LRR-repeat protein 20-like [Odontomachus brunneus]|uniref:F-box/LRR-repeat protein 20-like n=1 Tax=Odontomachus brunneus TaxID=486640 RepID=UPI0013F1B7E0|nr:F-box/LRR-repeat protein 20-like [Odontomachus brunneus]
MEALETRYTQLYRNITAYINDDLFSTSVDGVPIRKLFIGNLAERTSFRDVKNLFSAYGEVEGCYLCRNAGRRNYAFVTFNDVASAMKALKDGCSKQIRLHNRDLRIMVADSWNQPDSLAFKFSEKKFGINYTQEYTQEYFKSAPIHMLNDDCLIHIFKYLLIADRVRVERVCKRWKVLSQESWRTMKRLDISHFTWDHIWGKPIIYHISTAVLRKVLLKCGRFLTQIDLSEVPNYLGIGTLSMIARFCPNLTNIDVSALPTCTTGLSALLKKCKKITKLSLGASTHVLDSDLKNVFKEYRGLSHFAIRSNGDISGKCLSSLPAQTMRTLIVDQCHNIVDDDFSIALAKLENLEYLEICSCSSIGEKTLEVISKRCQNLRELRIHGYFSYLQNAKMLQFTNIVNLRMLQVTHFTAFSDEQLISAALSCPQITYVNISGCYNVNDAGLAAITTLPKLEYLYINLLTNITDKSLKNLANLKEFECHSCPLITDDGIRNILASSPQLQLLNLSKCSSITNATYEAARQICDKRPSNLVLKMFIWGTQIVLTDEHAISPFLQTVNVNMSYTGYR